MISENLSKTLWKSWDTFVLSKDSTLSPWKTKVWQISWRRIVRAARVLAIRTYSWTSGILIKTCISHRIIKHTQPTSSKELSKNLQNLWEYRKYADRPLAFSPSATSTPASLDTHMQHHVWRAWNGTIRRGKNFCSAITRAKYRSNRFIGLCQVLQHTVTDHRSFSQYFLVKHQRLPCKSNCMSST